MFYLEIVNNTRQVSVSSNHAVKSPQFSHFVKFIMKKSAKTPCKEVFYGSHKGS